MDAPKPRQFRYQYSIRALLILTALVAIFASVFGARFRQAFQQRSTAKAVGIKGARLKYDWQWSYVLWHGPPRLPNGPRWLRDLLGEDYFDDVVYVEVSGSQVDDALAELEGLRQLEKLNVNGTRVTREGVGKFRRALPRCEVFLLNPFIAKEPIETLS